MVEPANPSESDPPPLMIETIVYKIPKSNTEKEHVIKVFQIIEKVQNDVGLDIS